VLLESHLPSTPPALTQQRVGGPQPSASGTSQLFDALVLAAAGEVARHGHDRVWS